jgi:hypothetical protein
MIVKKARSTIKQLEKDWLFNFIRVVLFIVMIFIIFNIYVFHVLNDEFGDRKNKHLKFYSEAIESIIFKDLELVLSSQKPVVNFNIFSDIETKECSKEKTSVKTTYNTLVFENKTYCTSMNLSRYRDFLQNLSKNVFLYSISINNHNMITNNFEKKTKEYSNIINILDKYQLSLELSCLDNSEFVIYERNKLILGIIRSLVSSLLSVILISVFAFFYFRAKRDKRKILLSTDELKEFVKQESNFIIKCYQYSLKQNIFQDGEDYFPLPIMTNKAMPVSKIRISTEYVKRLLEDFFQFYENYHNNENYLFKTDLPTNVFFEIPFDKEVFAQVVISIIYNISLFNKNTNGGQKIIVNFNNNVLTIFSSGLKLNSEILITASEQIFFKSANPFILKFSQIFGILNQYGISYEIDYNQEGTKAIIQFQSSNIKNKTNDEKIIDLSQYKKGVTT